MQDPRVRLRMDSMVVQGLVFFVALTASGRAGLGQEDVPQAKEVTGPSSSELSARRLGELRQAAEAYQITLESDPPRRLTLRAEPVLRWSNPVRKTSDGAVFVWLADGRPEVVASLYRYDSDDLSHEDHEFQSLALTGLSSSRDGTAVWLPRTAGVTFALIPDAPAPAATPAERLRQMRALAQQFRASFDLPKDQSELRRLSQPILRYEARQADVADGALFAFVLTTDPEVLLLIEARPESGTLRWHYAFARMSMVNLRAEHKEKRVWSVDWQDKGGPLDKPYTTLEVVKRRRAEGASPAQDTR